MYHEHNNYDYRHHWIKQNYKVKQTHHFHHYFHLLHVMDNNVIIQLNIHHMLLMNIHKDQMNKFHLVLKNNQDQFVYWNNEYMILMMMLDIHHMKLVVFLNFFHDKHIPLLKPMKKVFQVKLIRVFHVRM